VSPEQLAAILVALAGLLTAVGVVLGQIVALRREMDGRLTQLLELTATSSHAAGVLEERGTARAVGSRTPRASKSLQNPP
jgi:hypothetical protein